MSSVQWPDRLSCYVGCYTFVKFPRLDDAGGGGGVVGPYGDLVSCKAALTRAGTSLSRNTVTTVKSSSLN